MASLKSGKCTEIKNFKFQDGMVLQVDVSVFSSGHNAKVKLQLQNCSQTWILHWGCISYGNKRWFVPSFYPPGTTVYKKAALSTPFKKDGDVYVVDIELRDPKIHAIEFVLKNTKNDKWLKMNGASFRIKLHEEIDVKIDDAGNAINETSPKEIIEKPLRHRILCTPPFFPKLSTSSSTWQGLSQKNNTFSNTYVMSLEETCSEMVGEKSCSIRFLSIEAPEWIKLPASIVLPFGVFEKVLSEDINKEVAKKIVCLTEHVDRGDISKLKTIQETVMQIKAPRRMSIEVRKKMKSSRLPWPHGRGEDTWNRLWHAMKMVWASKWNEGVYISCRKTNTNFDQLRIGILVQEYIRADYAFVTYTYHPVTQDSSEIYTEIVKGSVETLVGASLGLPMVSITKKTDLKSPIVTCYPSKSTGLYTKNKRSIIFRPDFIYGNTNGGYTSNGIFDSISMENKEEVVLDYSKDPLVTDLRFQALIHSKVAETAKRIEDLYGCAQIVEGVVQDEQVYVLQCKPLL
ncbi:hypothetical protein QVD17_01205 [Tagetes erecta]|uniref:Pyruvate phosphate dikinase AMP/ATP-binding domain-containing protein n=1 Tax=Tagetes erecta TaxID=13708 RepID=A0AAD8L5Z8_TARER|nr:hypothetical protein QVD17_01205 [Tagetes erecta]